MPAELLAQAVGGGHVQGAPVGHRQRLARGPHADLDDQQGGLARQASHARLGQGPEGQASIGLQGEAAPADPQLVAVQEHAGADLVAGVLEGRKERQLPR